MYVALVGYIFVIVLGVLLIPIVYLIFSGRGGKNIQGQKPIGKAVSVTEPAADEATPAASSIRQDTSKAQSRTPAA